jgi:hypothetical protein
MSTIIEYNDQSTASEEERRDAIKQMLQEGISEVTFTKVDGETRVMPCTLDSSVMPDQIVSQSTGVQRSFKPLTLSVWCTDQNEWRSFRVANVSRVEQLASSNPI